MKPKIDLGQQVFHLRPTRGRLLLWLLPQLLPQILCDVPSGKKHVIKKADVETLGLSSFVKVEIQDVPQPWFLLDEDLPLLDRVQESPAPEN